MASRLHDATAELRVRWVENGRTQEFVARIKAEKFTPMAVDIRRDQIRNQEKEPGGSVTLESRGPLDIDRREVPTLPWDVNTTIEKWLSVKRRELQEVAAKKVAAGAERVKINERGEMRKI